MLQSPVLVGAHFHPDALQNLFDSHVAVPVFHCGDLVFVDVAGFGIDAGHVDFRDEFQDGRNRRVVAGAFDSQLVKTTVVLRLRMKKQRIPLGRSWQMVGRNETIKQMMDVCAVIFFRNDDNSLCSHREGMQQAQKDGNPFANKIETQNLLRQDPRYRHSTP